ALQFSHTQVAQKLLAAEATRQLLEAPLIAFSDIGKVDLNKWDSLFDPTNRLIGANSSITSAQEIGSAKVISVYSLGQCSLKQGCPSQQERFAEVNVNGISINLDASTSVSNADLQVVGFAIIK